MPVVRSSKSAAFYGEDASSNFPFVLFFKNESIALDKIFWHLSLHALCCNESGVEMDELHRP